MSLSLSYIRTTMSTREILLIRHHRYRIIAPTSRPFLPMDHYADVLTAHAYTYVLQSESGGESKKQTEDADHGYTLM